MKSMTGFGKARVETGPLSVTVEISSVNRKQFDLRLNLANELREFEPVFRKMVAAEIQRGSINAKLTVDFAESLRPDALQINRSVAAYYMKEFNTLGESLGLSGHLDINTLAQLPQIITEGEVKLDLDGLKSTAEQAMAKALTALVAMRSAEGAALQSDLFERLGTLKSYVTDITERAPAVITDYKQRLEERIQQMLGEEVPVEADVLAREVAVFADRADISEEMTRMYSHFQQMEDLIKSDAGGRAMDFLIQEMFREINTTGSKANDSLIAAKVVAFKTELERMREQVQNIE